LSRQESNLASYKKPRDFPSLSQQQHLLAIKEIMLTIFANC